MTSMNRTHVASLKSRGGCITCRSRRVKCDETKPFCVRCQQMRLICGGYVTRSNRTRSKQKPQDAIRRLLPLMPKIPTTSTAAIPMVPSPSPQIFTNDQEWHYFRVFRDSTPLNFGEYLDSTLWNHIVLQASEQEFFITHAIIALGALDKSLDAPTASRDIHERGVTGGSEHTQAALQHYGQSIQGIRKACGQKGRSKRTILIACLLAICFEYHYGNVDLAIAHLENGIKLIDEWFLSIMHLASISEKHHAMLPGIIEDELISVFARLELDVSVWQAKHFGMHPDLQIMAMKIIQTIPADGFANFRSARTSFDAVLQQVDWFVRSIHEQLWAISDKSLDPKLETKSDNRFVETFPSMNQVESARTFKKILGDWSTAFQPLLKESSESGGVDLLATKAFCLRLACSSIALNCCFGPELCYDDFIPEFHAALSLADDLCSATSSANRSAFIVSSILIRSLFFIATKCRMADIRKKAIVRLKSMSRREGIWDARIASIFAIAVMGLEERSGNSIVPEHKRLRAIKTSFDLRKRHGRLIYLKRENVREEGFICSQVELSW